MVSAITLLTAAFFVAVLGFSVGVLRLSLREDVHSPEALRSEDAENG